jgi:hypothetical protein
MNATQAKKLRKDLKRQIGRADFLAFHCDEQRQDRSLSPVDRQTAEHRGALAVQTRRELKEALETLEEAMSDSNRG